MDKRIVKIAQEPDQIKRQYVLNNKRRHFEKKKQITVRNTIDNTINTRLQESIVANTKLQEAIDSVEMS